MKRVYNFSAGPSSLPEAVLQKAAEELACYKNHGMSVMEMSHRSPMYQEIFDETERLLREVMNIPANYKVLFLQGGASAQFAMVPMNLAVKNKKADYIDTGMWSSKAIEEAKRYIDVAIPASSKDKNFNYIPDMKKVVFRDNIDYVHITTNNTIFGTRITELPNVGNVPLISDMSSCILSEPVDVSKYGVIYAGAQKNIGPAGLTVVIIREDLIGNAMDITPTMFKYKIHNDNGSMYNTPPTYGIYFAKLVFEWLKDLGGLTAMQKLNEDKAGLFYDYLDGSAMFKATVEKKDRSLMNIPFVTGREDIDKKFVKEADKNGFVNLAGHRSVGGMRASMYNAMPKEGVIKLVEFMKNFEMQNK